MPFGSPDSDGMGGQVVAIVPSAGLGRRLGEHKPAARLHGKPLLAWSLLALEASESVDEIIPVLRDDDRAWGKQLVAELGIRKVHRFARGGPERQDSVRNGLAIIEGPSAIVLVHDGARPLVTPHLVAEALAGLPGHEGAVLAVPVKDTIKEADDAQCAARTLDRGALWAVQTPQVFLLEALREAHAKARREGIFATDDAMLIERRGGRVKLIMGSYENMKITTPEDLAVAEALLAMRRDS